MAWLWLGPLLLLMVWVTGCASLPANIGRTSSVAFNAPEETALGRLVQARRVQSATRGDSGFRLLESVDSAFTSRLALIEGAQRSLDLQYYAIHADVSTEILLQRLREAARRGVRVRVLLDDFNTVGPDAQVLLLAFEPNIQMRLFNPLPGSRSSLLGRLLTSLDDIRQAQKRMHNKLFIADNAMGIAGGRNLGDVYFGAGEESNFVDLDVLAVGRIVRDMSASFDRYWNDELAFPVQTLLSRQDLDALRQSSRRQAMPRSDPSQAAATQPAEDVARSAVAGSRPPAAAPVTATDTILPGITMTAAIAGERQPMSLQHVSLTWAPAVLMVDKPDKISPGDDEVDAGDTLIDGLLNLMEQARQDVLIVSPYFVPGQPMMNVFARLRAKGIRVRVLTNSLASNDAPAAHAGYARYRKGLLAMGVELYELRAEQPAPVGGRGSTSGLGIGSGMGIGAGSGSATTLGRGPGGSTSGASRASLHSKAVIIDNRLAVIGSMNLDLRSQLQNSEVALLIRSVSLAREATRLVETTFARGAYRLEMAGDTLHWRAPAGALFGDAATEPGAGVRLRLLVNVLGPFAPEELL